MIQRPVGFVDAMGGVPEGVQTSRNMPIYRIIPP